MSTAVDKDSHFPILRQRLLVTVSLVFSTVQRCVCRNGMPRVGVEISAASTPPNANADAATTSGGVERGEYECGHPVTTCESGLTLYVPVASSA